MRELLPDILPSVPDWETLVKMWKVVPRGSRAEQLVESRMEEIISAVSPDAVPDWFWRYLKIPGAIQEEHPHLAIYFCDNAQKLLATLEAL
jgi:hypothetical protein